MPKFVVKNGSVKHNGTLYKQGKTVEMSDEDRELCDPEGHHLVTEAAAKKLAEAAKASKDAAELDKGGAGEKGNGKGGAGEKGKE